MQVAPAIISPENNIPPSLRPRGFGAYTPGPNHGAVNLSRRSDNLGNAAYSIGPPSLGQNRVVGQFEICIRGLTNIFHAKRKEASLKLPSGAYSLR